MPPGSSLIIMCPVSQPIAQWLPIVVQAQCDVLERLAKNFGRRDHFRGLSFRTADSSDN